jgi:hypothetical protein
MCVTFMFASSVQTDSGYVAVGAWVPVSQVAEHEVAAYRKLEEDKASKALDDLVCFCKTQGVCSLQIPSLFIHVGIFAHTHDHRRFIPTM